MNLLNENNPVHQFFNLLGDIIIANLLFLLCSLPLITIGPSLTALYHCMLRTVKGSNPGTVRTFFRALKENFVQSLLAWIGFLGAAAVLFLNLRFLETVNTAAGQLFLYLSLAVAGLLFLLFLYTFPVIAAFSDTLTHLLRNAAAFLFLHFPSTLIIATVSFLPLYMTYLDLKLLPLYAFCWFFFGFGLTAFLNSLLFYRMFKPFLANDTDTQKENP